MNEFDRIVEELAQLATARYYTITAKEGKPSLDAMREIVRTILEAYRESIAS